MALPKLDTPKYQLELPSTGETIPYRPFLVKEQKVIMMAQESKDEDQMIQAVSDLVESCTFGKVNASVSPTFDIEYIFLKIRGKSVGETTEVGVICPDDKVTRVSIKVNFDDISVLTSDDHSNEIQITETVKLNLRYPVMSDMKGLKSQDAVKTPFKVLGRCIHSIQFGDDVYNKVDISEKEIEDFIDELTAEQFEKVMDFFNSMPKVRHIVDVINPKTKVKSEVVLEGLQSFLA